MDGRRRSSSWPGAWRPIRGAGLIQTVPRLIGARTPLAPPPAVRQPRLRPGPRRAASPAWSGDAGNYWGHNAIVRTRAFAARGRSADAARPAALRRPYPQPRLRRGGAAAPRRLDRAARRRPPGLVRGRPPNLIELVAARPPLVPGQSPAPAAAGDGAGCIRLSRLHLARARCPTSPRRSGCCSCSPAWRWRSTRRWCRPSTSRTSGRCSRNGRRSTRSAPSRSSPCAWRCCSPPS